jgi:hypothetical protein
VQADSSEVSTRVSLAPSTVRGRGKEVGELSSRDAAQEGWFKRNADAIGRWSERFIFLGAYVIGIHRVSQHAFVHASLWCAAGVGGTVLHVADARGARRNAEQARRQQLHRLAEVLREVAERKTDLQKR